MMSRFFSPGFLLVLAALAAAALLANAHQWRGRVALRTELELARAELAELDRLKAENERLLQQQIAPPELARLRADHAALPRLRAELEALRQGRNGSADRAGGPAVVR